MQATTSNSEERESWTLFLLNLLFFIPTISLKWVIINNYPGKCWFSKTILINLPRKKIFFFLLYIYSSVHILICLLICPPTHLALSIYLFLCLSSLSRYVFGGSNHIKSILNDLLLHKCQLAHNHKADKIYNSSGRGNEGALS